MIKLVLQLFYQFFHIGVFSFGGGYATLPFLYDIAEKYGWFTTSQLTNMLAVSSITPGPIGVNMATFAGFSTFGITGAFIATFSIMLPSFIFVTIVYKILNKFSTNKYIKCIVKALKPAGCALLSAVGIKLLFTSNMHLMGIIILVSLIITGTVKKLNPVCILGICAILGYIFGAVNIIGI